MSNNGVAMFFIVMGILKITSAGQMKIYKKGLNVAFKSFLMG